MMDAFDYEYMAEKYAAGSLTDAERALHEAACDCAIGYKKWLRENVLTNELPKYRFGTTVAQSVGAYYGFIKGVQHMQK